MNLLPESPFSWLAMALLLFWFVGAHNRLLRLRVLALGAFATLDAALLRQLELVQASGRTGASHGEAEAPSVVVASSDDVLRAALQASAAQFIALLSAARLQPLQPDLIAALSTSLHVMLGAWQRLYPDVPPSIAWPEPSAAAEVARGQFNLAVARYNAAVGEFPALLVAWLFRLRSAAPME